MKFLTIIEFDALRKMDLLLLPIPPSYTRRRWPTIGFDASALTSHARPCHTCRMVEVFTSDEFKEWYAGLNDDFQCDVTEAVGMLERRGVALGHPHSSAIKGSRFPLRELRVQSHGHPIRVVYAFDPDRDAYLIIGGDKTGEKRFYERLISQAERIWLEYLTTFSERSWPWRKGSGTDGAT